MQKNYLKYKETLVISLFTLLFGVIVNISFAQHSCNSFQTDIQGNEYTINNNELIKKKKSTSTTFRYSNKLYGNLYAIDVSNPLRVLLFYKEAQKIIITDNTLSEQSQQVISLEEVNLFQTQAIANSKMGNEIWMYDQEDFQLIKIDPFLNRIIETGNLEQLLNLDSIKPIKMIEQGAFLYLHCAHNGILVFDIYGTYYKSIPIENLKNWNIYNSYLYYITNSEIGVMNLKTNEFDLLKPKKEVKNLYSKVVQISNQFIYYCENDSLQKIEFK